MSSRILLLMPAFALTAPLYAQDMAPELLPLATKYRADAAALDTQKKEAIERVAQVYGAALEAAEKAETTAGHVTVIAAITAESDELKKGELMAEFPNDFPKSLHTARKTYVDGVMHVVGDFGQRRQRLAADYLRVLSTMQTRVAANPILAKQILDEKERALKAAAAASGAELEYRLIGTTWTWDGRFPVTFLRDGKSVSRDGLTWTASKPTAIEYSFPNGNHGTIDFDPAMARATITEIREGGQKARMALVRTK